MDAHTVLDALERRYAAPAWAFLREVRNTTGQSGKDIRYADAVAMSLYPSRGLSIQGFEVKVQRADWKRELALPDKSVPIQKFCDQWWVVAAPNVVKPDEVPENWGLMVVTKRVMITKDAPRLEAAPPDRGFVASLFRRANEYVTSARLADERFQDGFRAGEEAASNRLTFEQEREARKLKRLQEGVDAFEAASGLKINDFNGGHLGEMVALAQAVKASNNIDVQRLLKNARWPLEHALKTLDTLAAINRIDAAKT